MALPPGEIIKRREALPPGEIIKNLAPPAPDTLLPRWSHHPKQTLRIALKYEANRPFPECFGALPRTRTGTEIALLGILSSSDFLIFQ